MGKKKTLSQLPKKRKDNFLDIPDYIKAEAYLENLGFFIPSSSKRVMSENLANKGKSAKIKKIINQETKEIETTKIRPNDDLGFPTTYDLDFYRAFLKICAEYIDENV